MKASDSILREASLLDHGSGPSQKTGPITISASTDAYGFEYSRFLGAVYSWHIEVRYLILTTCGPELWPVRSWTGTQQRCTKQSRELFITLARYSGPDAETVVRGVTGLDGGAAADVVIQVAKRRAVAPSFFLKKKKHAEDHQRLATLLPPGANHKNNITTHSET